MMNVVRLGDGGILKINDPVFTYKMLTYVDVFLTFDVRVDQNHYFPTNKLFRLSRKANEMTRLRLIEHPMPMTNQALLVPTTITVNEKIKQNH